MTAFAVLACDAPLNDSSPGSTCPNTFTFYSPKQVMSLASLLDRAHDAGWTGSNLGQTHHCPEHSP